MAAMCGLGWEKGWSTYVTVAAYVMARGVRGAVWFGFKHNNHPNREREKHTVWFGSVDF
ncbi:hypothetical protein MTR_5g005910 [Medicago truncatula]|uniref:Uncharacterized protein n=1 Tax=Medicago truncatula TaxID=3880 RepID=G7K2A8_MEDTR|nr:hypothetical protein MTR_5g005910 [Medicago truncatula]